jgi:alkylation response protein AidB-like acyl-CoA dehydrogenase
VSDGAVEAARRIADDVLRPTAQVTDQSSAVPAGHLALLAEAGLFGLHGPRSHGGASTPGADIRAVQRLLGGACGATSFVWTQHQSPVTLLANTPNAALRDAWLPRLCRGEVVGGTVFAHLRRPGPPALLATPDADGFRLDGEAPWASGWGRAGVYAVAAFTGDGDVLWCLVDGREQRGLSASDPLPLAVMQASATVRMRFDGFAVPDDRVLLQLPPDLWWSIDDVTAARLNPAVLGVVDTALDLLGRAEGTGGLAEDVAEVLSTELASCAAHCEALAGSADGGSADPAALARARSWGLDLAQRATAALLATSGGRGIELADPAQRLVREAAFYTVQAQTAPGRDATLRRMLQPSSPMLAAAV